MDTCDGAASAEFWAAEEFGHANLGDWRRTKRLVQMATCAALFPSGKLSDVFQSSADKQGAYKFVESERVTSEPISESIGLACVHRCSGAPFVFVAVDGSSLTLTDRAKAKNFGAIGSYCHGARGLKVVGALAVDPNGVPVGLASMQWWARGNERRVSSVKRKLEDKELGYWLRACTETIERFAQKAPQCRPWFQLDREADAWQLLVPLSKTGHLFTVRSNCNRRIVSETGERRKVLDELARPQSRKGTFSLHVSEGPQRQARKARMTLFAAPVSLVLRDKWSQREQVLTVHAVRVLESSTVPNGEKPIEWVLYTNHPIKTLEDLLLVINGYSQRWRIEDFFGRGKQALATSSPRNCTTPTT